MATARQILELLRSHVEGDDERFRTAALQMAAHEARQGHEDLAKQIQNLISKAPKTIQFPDKAQKSNSIPFARPQGELAGLLEVVQPHVTLSQLILWYKGRGQPYPGLLL